MYIAKSIYIKLKCIFKLQYLGYSKLFKYATQCKNAEICFIQDAANLGISLFYVTKI